ncbi:Transcriptional regulator, TetR family [Bacillus sp. THAF10]|nr:Transcriptional regulator, TetR family [Bacillus sp. THAF10]
MDQVAKIANVGKGTIYTFYSNKEELFSEIIAGILKEMRTVAERSIKPDKSFFENAHLALISLLDFRNEHQLTVKLIQEEKEIGTKVVNQELHRLEEMIICFIKEKIEIAIEKEEIRKCNSEITAFIMLKLYVALVVDWEEHHTPLSKEEIANLFELYFVKGLSL